MHFFGSNLPLWHKQSGMSIWLNKQLLKFSFAFCVLADGTTHPACTLCAVQVQQALQPVQNRFLTQYHKSANFSLHILESCREDKNIFGADSLYVFTVLCCINPMKAKNLGSQVFPGSKGWAKGKQYYWKSFWQSVICCWGLKDCLLGQEG